LSLDLRVKISVSLPSDLVARLDQAARSEARARNRVLKTWLRTAARGEAARDVEAGTIAYYQSLTAEERREEQAMASAFSAAARRSRVDDSGRPGPRRKRRR
jgi:metal-responsive CopG/Arc/MetJ family transcriptional regulator